MRLFFHIGRYSLLMGKVFTRPDKGKIFYRRFTDELQKIGIESLGLVIIMSVFMGAVITIQAAANIESPLIPKWTIGFATRQSIILEFSPTIIAIILVGKVGSNIASEIGIMRIYEQIDALDVMGVNSANYLILPKIVAAMFINPFVIIVSMYLGVLGGWFACVQTGILPSSQYIEGIQREFVPFHVTYALIKSVVFAFVITSIPAYHGYFTKGGALEVGKSSTDGVVHSTVIILILNLIITQLLLI